MPAVNRKSDPLITGHGCDAVSILTTPMQGTVRANGILVARKGDFTIIHQAYYPPYCSGHAMPITTGSGTVRVAGSSVARKNDIVDMGTLTSGSGNVFAG